VKVVILASGLETRLAEETEVRPKPIISVDMIAAIGKLIVCISGSILRF
jgi:NDP-sugar pyrophosphorylase family protein